MFETQDNTHEEGQAAAARSRPALTTVHQSHVEKGRQAGRLIIDLLHDKPEVASVTLETKLVIRESSTKVP